MIEPKPEVANTPPAHHGAFDYDELRQLGYSPDEVIDFSVNSNPYGPPPGVREAIMGVPLDRYPDRECIALREKLAERHSSSVEHFVFGNGTAELLNLVATAFVRPGDRAVVLQPSFSEYARAVGLMGGHVETYVIPKTTFEVDYDVFEALLRRVQPRVCMICSPNNPTGVHFAWDEIEDLSEIFKDTLWVIDEAYAQFTQPPNSGSVLGNALDGGGVYGNLLVIRSLTKDYALAGLRLGYAIGHPDIIEAVRRVRPAWNVNGMAQAAGLAALDQDEWLRDTVNKLHEDKQTLVAGLNNLGYAPRSSSVHYFLVNVENGAAFRAKLLKHKIMVRDCASFGLPEYVRIATRTPEDNAKLLAAVEMVQRDG